MQTTHFSLHSRVNQPRKGQSKEGLWCIYISIS